MTSPHSAPPILILDRVSKRFAGHTAVDHLSLSVPGGVIYGLLGPNGAGKTTTIRMIMDILEPDGGAVRIFGEPGGGRAHAERIGYLPEERGLYRKMLVLDPHNGAGREAVRTAVHHRAGAEARGRRALGHQADARRTPSRHRVRREPRRGGAGVRGQNAREQGGQLRPVCRARARVRGRSPADAPTLSDDG